MSNRKAVETRASELDAEVVTNEEDRTHLDVEVLAPDGFVWAGDGVHSLVGVCENPNEKKADVWADLMERMSDGLEKCTKADCDSCGDAP